MIFIISRPEARALNPILRNKTIAFSGAEMQASIVFCEAKRASIFKQQNSSLGNFAATESNYLVSG
jgi:hypothetical protein